MNKDNKKHEIQVHFMEGLIMPERLLKNMSKDFLSGLFYFLIKLGCFI